MNFFGGDTKKLQDLAMEQENRIKSLETKVHLLMRNHYCVIVFVLFCFHFEGLLRTRVLITNQNFCIEK